jgi:hypothetical protein
MSMATLRFYQPHDHQHVVTHPSVSAEIAQLNSMSRQSPKAPPSPSPSKSSLRSTSVTTVKGVSTAIAQTRGLGLLPSPTFEEVPRTASPKTVGFDENALHAQDDSAVAAELIEQPAFQPFFTLISDSLTSEHYHPTVHYIFADDEEGPEVISDGVLRSLHRLEQVDKDKNATESEHKIREYVLVLDIDLKPSSSDEAPGYEIIQAQSLSADWQVGNVEVTNAPTMSEEDNEGGLMLRIEGRGPVVDDRGHEMGRESLEDLVIRYQRGLEGVRAMLDSGQRIEQTS